MSTAKLQRVLSALAVALWAVATAGAHGDDGDIRQTAARLGYVSGDVSYSRGDDPDYWQPAEPNTPMVSGDGVYTGDDGRLELHLPGGMRMHLVPRTQLTALDLTNDTVQFAVDSGTVLVRLPRFAEDQVYEIDTPNAAITLDRSGDYRVDVDPDGPTRVRVRAGRATVAAGGGQVGIGAGHEIVLEGTDAPHYEVVGLPPRDSWDHWSEERDRELSRASSYRYVNSDVAGVEDLDTYGHWRWIPNHGWCWSPRDVEVGWAPYRVGRWVWQDPWGWTWVSSEPWGWAPYHYGRWVVWSGRWYWVPAGPQAPVSYAPALVAFTGGGPGWSVSVGFASGGFVGWFPLAPADPFLPWWGRPRATVDVTNVTYVNRTYVTVVEHTTFVSARPVGDARVHDRTIVREITRAPVCRGPVPVVPTRESIRVSTRQAPEVRPARSFSRGYVTRNAPPAPPPRFDAKAAWIRANGGAPVAPREAARLAEREPSRGRAAQRMRPAASESGRVVLAAKGETARMTPPEPVAPPRGRSSARSTSPETPAQGRQPRESEREGAVVERSPGARDPRESEAVHPPPHGRVPLTRQRPDSVEPEARATVPQAQREGDAAHRPPAVQGPPQVRESAGSDPDQPAAPAPRRGPAAHQRPGSAEPTTPTAPPLGRPADNPEREVPVTPSSSQARDSDESPAARPAPRDPRGRVPSPRQRTTTEEPGKSTAPAPGPGARPAQPQAQAQSPTTEQGAVSATRGGPQASPPRPTATPPQKAERVQPSERTPRRTPKATPKPKSKDPGDTQDAKDKKPEPPADEDGAR